MPVPRRSRVASLLAAVPLAAALCLPGATAQADEPVHVGWTGALPAFAHGHDPSSSDDCLAGRTTCVQRTVRDMQRRFEPLARSCRHSAVFALAYLRTTETYLETARTPGFYADPAFVNHEDVTFARLYTEAYDAWAEGRVDAVPPAWRTAFAAGDASRVTGTGDLLLGMNAHVNRDLPFVLAAVGLVAPDGTSRKGDHDRINEMLNRVVQPLIEEEAARFDPSMQRAATPYGLGQTGVMQVLLAWREAAWRQAERLVAAPDDASRAHVAAQIEAAADASAAAIVATHGYTEPLSSTRTRDAHCAARAGSEG